MKIKPIILSGGSGERLWPLSRKNMPKQFVDLFSSGTNLFEQTLIRVKDSAYAEPIIISNKEQRFDVLNNVKKNKVKIDKMILEDTPKNTAPAFAVASNVCKENDILCFLPSDHYIKNTKSFLSAIKNAAKLADQGQLVILGLNSTYPNTNYGYIKYSKIESKNNFYQVKSFIEKPALEKAKVLHRSKAFWNSGIVVIKNNFLKNLFEKYSKDLYLLCQDSFLKSYKDNEFTFLGKDSWEKISPISFDYAILEKKFKKLVVPLNTNWSDLGTYESLFDVNSSIGDVIKFNTKNSFTYSNDKLLVTSDVDNLIIVNTNNATLVTKKGNSSNIREIVKNLSLKNRTESITDSFSNRPWGSFTTLGTGKGYKVKKLIILPGHKISLQKHLKRSEHWVVIKGIASIIKGKEKFILKPNQSTFIKKGEIHRIENKTNKSLIMIEVQTGNYLEEDDIKRYKDEYNR